MTDKRNTAPGGKYNPLYFHLMRLAGNEWRASFRDVEKVLGFPLPDSARRYEAWWENNDNRHVQAPAWLNAGWQTDEVNLGKETLVFRRA